ncbi:hypothetical protein D3C75_985420 [compost metagenome]
MGNFTAIGFQHLCNQPLLSGKMEEHRTVGNTRRLGNIGHSGGLDALGGEDIIGGLQQRRSGLFLLQLARCFLHSMTP